VLSRPARGYSWDMSEVGQFIAAMPKAEMTHQIEGSPRRDDVALAECNKVRPALTTASPALRALPLRQMADFLAIYYEGCA